MRRVRNAVAAHRTLRRATICNVPYQKGLQEVAAGVWAYLQPDGGWGWSNAGLVTGDDNSSLLVDTLFDLRLTAEMLDAMRRTTPAARDIATVVNTHANGDHCYGNALLGDAEIVSSARCAEEMAALPPSAMAATLAPHRPRAGGSVPAPHLCPVLLRRHPPHCPVHQFEGRLDLQVGGRACRCSRSGRRTPRGRDRPPAGRRRRFHRGHPLSRGHPIVWAGPVANWIAACDRIVELGPAVVVPGHGPLATVAAVEELRGYFALLSVEGGSASTAG